MGVNVVYAPGVRPGDATRATPVIGIRSFGDDPAAGRAAGGGDGPRAPGGGASAATVKHFPGLGRWPATRTTGCPSRRSTARALRARELVPFRAGIAAGARLVDVGHVAVPAADRRPTCPRPSLPSSPIDLLRGELGFAGVTSATRSTWARSSDHGDLAEIVSQSVRAGVDLMLTLHPFALEERALDGLVADARAGTTRSRGAARFARRIGALRRWLGRAPAQPELDVVGSAAHVALAARDRRAGRDARARPAGPRAPAAAVRRPVADRRDRPAAGRPDARPTPPPTRPWASPTRCATRWGSAGRPASVTALEMPLDPDPAAIAALCRSRRPATVTIVGTVDALAHPGPGPARRGAGRERRARSSRSPCGRRSTSSRYPGVGTYACTYGIQPPNLRAMADALLGRIPFRGRLPVRLEGH